MEHGRKCAQSGICRTFFGAFARGGQYTPYTPWTISAFMALSGKVLFPTFVNKHLNRTIKQMRQTESEYTGEYVDTKGKTQKFKRLGR